MSIYFYSNSCAMPSHTKNVNILSLLWSYRTLKLFKGLFGKETHHNSFASWFLALSRLCFLSRTQTVQGRENWKHLKLDRWRKIMTNSYWWRSCGTLNYTQSKAICTVLNCGIWAWRRSHLILLYLIFLVCCPLGRDKMVRWWFWGWLRLPKQFS